MPDFNTFVDIAQTAPFIAVFYFLWKSGAIKIGNSKKNGNGYQCQIDALNDHAKVANDEMKIIKKDISEIKVDVSFIRVVISKD